MVYNLTPSNSHLWTRCPYSAEVQTSTKCNSIPSASVGTAPNPQAALGTKAHMVARAAIQLLFKSITHSEYNQICNEAFSELSITKQTQIIKEANQYKYYVMQEVGRRADQNILPVRWATEYNISLDKLLDCPGAKGICDLYILYENELFVIDFKYGDKFEIYPDNNTQLLIYASAFLLNNPSNGINKIHLCIYQNGEWRETVKTKEEIEAWENTELKSAVYNVYHNHDITKVGSWCNEFCPKRSKCKAHIAEVLGTNADLTDLSKEDLLKAYNSIQNQKKTISYIEDYIKDTIEGGQDITGLTVLYIERTSISDEPKATKALLEYAEQNGIDPVDIVKLRGKEDITKVINPDKADEILSPYTKKVKCKGKLAPDTRKKR